MHWPELSAKKDGSTLGRLHLISQMVGKLKVANSPWVNHGWHIALHPVAEGLAMQPIAADGRRFTLTIDLCAHRLALKTNNGTEDAIALADGDIADVHAALIGMLDRHGLPSSFHGSPNELEEVTPFAEDRTARPYDEDSARRLHHALAAIVPVFDRHRAAFVGKSSPTHFFWGSFDLAVTRFSGREAPKHPGGFPNMPDAIAIEAYSHEVSSAGFWAGGAYGADPLFYAYAYPDPDGYRDGDIAHGEWSDELSEFVLPYEKVRSSDDPETMLLEFMDSAYAIAAEKADWPKGLLRVPVRP